LNPLLYTNLSGEELERKVNDSWKEGVNYLNGQKVSGFSGGVLKSSAYVASVKDAMDDAGLTEMTLSLGFGIAAARNKAVIPEKTPNPVPKNYSQIRKYWKKEVVFKGTKVYQRDNIIDINKVDIKGRTNLQRMEKGLAPLGSDGNPINLHHMTQREISSIAEVEQSFHQINSKTIHINPNSIPTGIDRKAFNKWRSDYWKERAKEFK
ncbi:hypothetical protein HB801_12125, partial [Listeria welshimeri]|nr:hypothetical protein [Listeria welshimeri]